MQIWYATTIFLAAALLFFVQPMVARKILPLLGGSAAVWNTCLVFFQAALLAGYLYAHLTTKWLGARRQSWLHLVALLLPFLVLPIAITANWSPPTGKNPIPWLLWALTVSVGLPFFVVAATSPLLQKWFSATTHRFAHDPYFLYSASNFGSLLGLLSYPILVEPTLRLREQSAFWSSGYSILAILMAGCAWFLWKNAAISATAAPDLAEADAKNEALTAGRRVRWVFLAFAPCSLMLSVTTFLTTDVAPVPLLWVIPLSVYLLTYILVFARRPPISHRWMLRALPFLVLPLSVLLAGRASKPFLLVAAWHVATLFVAGMVCHGELAEDRPPTRHLTEFYLWIGIGGVLGGAFNALLAPLIFSSVVEYPLTLVLVFLLLWRYTPMANERRQRLLDIALPLGLAALGANLAEILSALGIESVDDVLFLKFVVPPLLCFTFYRRSLRFALGVAAVFYAGAWYPGERELELHRERTFFGIHRVSMTPQGDFHQLYHGSTIHGIQCRHERYLSVPLTYYTQNGPLGQLFDALYAAKGPNTVALVGLGAGSSLPYGKDGQRWTIYEIDPAVVRIAQESDYFTFLSDCRAEVRIVLGDARLSLAATDEKYDLMILDAYNSDAVPVHLITREALQLYLDRLAPRGVMAFHISNRFLKLKPVIGNLAHDAGLICLIQNDGNPTPEEIAMGKSASEWAVVARHPDDLALLLNDSRWEKPPLRPEIGVWSDDFYSIFRVFKWK
jgi:hypothetical protein